MSADRENKHGGTVKSFIGLMVVLVLVAVIMPSCEPAFAAAVSPAKITLSKATTIYYDSNTFLTGKSVDTLVWSSDRNFNDTANYDCGVFLTNGTTAGPLKATILNDSSVIVTSATAGDSVKYYFFQVIIKKK
jgi:hypothetical protein